MLEMIRTGRSIHDESTNRAWGGKDNPAALRASVKALELNRPNVPHSAKVRKAWKLVGFKESNYPKVIACPAIATEMARIWIEQFNWDIVVAEATLGKKNSRNITKMIVYGKIYGAGPAAIRYLLKCTYEEACSFMNDFDKAFPRMKRFMYAFSNAAGRRGYILTPFGDRIEVDPKLAYRAVNYLIQGSAATFLKRKMIEVDRYVRSIGLDIYMLMPIHDELVFEIREGHQRLGVLRTIQKIMEDHEGVFRVVTPVVCNKVVSRWDEKKKVPL